MVCNRCIMVVDQELRKIGLKVLGVTLGEVNLDEDELTADQLKKIDQALTPLGFERLDDRRSKLIEGIKSNVIQHIHGQKSDQRFNWSKILSDAFHYDYNYLSNLFSSTEGITIEQFIIRQKIERVKELLFYDELTLSQIASELGYSSVAHLSAQFKKVTGLTPTDLKKTRQPGRKPLDAVSGNDQ